MATMKWQKYAIENGGWLATKHICRCDPLADGGALDLDDIFFYLLRVFLDV
jgi:putative component of membrane protein insertase Oxa1/YidC/SpoIIIJ protein YidD